MNALSVIKRVQERTHQRIVRESQNGYKSSQWFWWRFSLVA